MQRNAASPVLLPDAGDTTAAPADPAPGSNPPGGFDPRLLRRLIDLAGPANASELLARLSEDLSTARNQASRAAQSDDWATLRGASHVLIALAGSVGARSLHALAIEVNAAAHAEQTEALVTLLSDLLAETDALICVVSATTPDGGGLA